ncbi:MAG: hypothetical protein AAFV88_00575 [Planctomycetota bacterium]
MPSLRRCRPALGRRVFGTFQTLEERKLLTAAMEVYAWDLVNQMRADPSGFANELEAMVRGTGPAANSSTGHGYDSSDPLWDDVRRTINFSAFPEHFDEALALLRSRDPQGPLGWEDSLHTRSSDHNDWMETHCFAHSQYGAGGSSSCGGSLPGFDQPGINGDPDIVTAATLGPWSSGAWGENIGYGAGTPMSFSRSEFGDTDAYLQRLAYGVTLGFIIEVNSTSLGHLENLLSRDADGSGQMNTIGIHIDVYPVSPGQFTTSYLVTHTLSNRRRTDDNQDGAYVAGVAYQDNNSNGHFDLGEQLDVTSINGETVTGTNGRVSAYLPEGTPQLTVMSGQTVIADYSVTLGDSNEFLQLASASSSPDTIGLFQADASFFHLKESLTAGPSDHLFQFGAGDSGWTPLVGDWNGDGIDTIGLYQSQPSLFHLKNSHGGGGSDVYFAFGPSGSDWIPIVGDWDGDGSDTVGFYQPDLSLFHLKNSFAPGSSDIYFQFGSPGSGWIPLAGDWDGDGTDTIGFYQGDASLFHLKNSFAPGQSDVYFQFGPTGNAGWTPLVGDWNGDGTDTIGLYQGDASLFHLKDSFSAGASDHYFVFGPAGGGWLPLAGDWAGDAAGSPSSGGSGDSGARSFGARSLTVRQKSSGGGDAGTRNEDWLYAVDTAVQHLF